MQDLWVYSSPFVTPATKYIGIQATGAQPCFEIALGVGLRWIMWIWIRSDSSTSISSVFFKYLIDLACLDTLVFFTDRRQAMYIVAPDDKC